MAKRTDNPAQMILWADIVADPIGGGFRIVPRKPTTEIPASEAAAILGVARSSLKHMINSQLGQKHLRWRWTSERKGKRIFELESVREYREATKGIDHEGIEDRVDGSHV